MDDKQFEQLAMAELDAVYRLACRLTSASHEAEDAVQETYLRAFRAASSFKLAGFGIRPWLFKILHNVVYTGKAREERQKSIVEGLHHEQLGATKSGDAGVVASSGLCGLNWDNVDGQLKAAIDALPDSNRVAFLLSAVEGLRYREISEVTGVPIGTVMSRLYRAREMLASLLANSASGHRRGNLGGPANT